MTEAIPHHRAGPCPEVVDVDQGHRQRCHRWVVRRAGDAESVATLQTTFRPHEVRHGLLDLNTAVIRDGHPRLTQAISQWVNTLSDRDGESVAGIWV